MKLSESIVSLKKKLLLLDIAKKAFMKREMSVLYENELLSLNEYAQCVQELINEVLNVESWQEFEDLCFKYDRQAQHESFNEWIMELIK